MSVQDGQNEDLAVRFVPGVHGAGEIPEFDTGAPAMLIVDHAHIVDCNAVAVGLFGFASRDELRAARLPDLCPPTSGAERRAVPLTEQFTACLAARTMRYFDWALRDKAGRIFHCEITTWAFQWERRDLLLVTLQSAADGHCRADRPKTRPQADGGNRCASDLSLHDVIKNLPVIVHVLDASGVFLLSEGQGLAALGLTPADFVGRSLNAVYRDKPDVPTHFRAALRGETTTTTTAEGHCIFETRYAPMGGALGSTTHVMITARDVTSSWDTQRRLEHLAHHDTLTGLPNRIRFADRVAEATHRANRTGQPFAVLFVDIDEFKAINDSLGHATGDRILKMAAKRFAAVMRESDTVARIGGDEFAVLIEGLTSPQDAAVAAQKLLDVLTALLTEERIPTDCSASVGISLYPNHGDALDTLLANADIAMYRAKRQRNTYRFFAPEMLVHRGAPKPPSARTQPIDAPSALPPRLPAMPSWRFKR